MAAIIVIAEDLLAVVSAVDDVVTRFIGPRLPTRAAPTLQFPFGAFRSALFRLATYFTSKSRSINRLRTVSPPFDRKPTDKRLHQQREIAKLPSSSSNSKGTGRTKTKNQV